MPTEKPRFTIILEPEIAEQLEIYWHSHKLKNKNAAINELLRMVLADKDAFSTDEIRLVKYYRKAPTIAKQMSLKALQTAVNYSNTHYSYLAADLNPLDGTPKEPAAIISNDSITFTEKLDSMVDFTRELESNDQSTSHFMELVRDIAHPTASTPSEEAK